MRSHTIGKNVVTNSSYRQSLKKFLQHLGAAVGVGCIPIVVFDAVGCPVSIVGSSMEVSLWSSGPSKTTVVQVHLQTVERNV